MSDELGMSIIDKYFRDNPNCLVQHHINSYNDFFGNGLKRIFKEKNPIVLLKQQDEISQEYKLRSEIYIGGKEGNLIYYGKPIIFDGEREHFMYPNEARLRNMTYAITIHYDVEVDFFIAKEDGSMGEEPSKTIKLDKIFLGRFPIMLMSDLCILKGLDSSIKFEMGECKNDYGGYFIIDGKEKCIISQEKFADNMLYIRNKVDEIYSHSAEIRSVSEDASKPVRTVSVRIVAPTPSQSNNQIVVNIPNVRKPIPLFIVMRALGIESDKDIIEHCLLDMEKYQSYIELFIPSIHDSNRIFNQEVAIKYIASFTKGKTYHHALEILTDYFLPHIGEMNFLDKGFFLGFMVLKLLKVFTNDDKPTDRDSFKYKRVELTGSLLYDLFKEYYTIQQKNIYQKIDKEYYYKQGIYNKNFFSLIESNYKDFFSERIVEKGFRLAFKGNWGSEDHTKRLGIVQDLNRLSYNSAISHLRKINLPLDASAKVIGPRLLHSSQWGIIDPVDTPDGGNVGLHKHMSILAFITSGCSSKPLIKWLKLNSSLHLLTESKTKTLSNNIKVFINGSWVGNVDNPISTVDKLKFFRRNALIPIYTSIEWNIADKIIYLYTDAGRLCRPIFHLNARDPFYLKKNIIEKIKTNKFTWNNLISGFSNKKHSVDLNSQCVFYNNEKELYSVPQDELLENQAIIDYIDTSEEEGALIAINIEKSKNKNYTHIEIHPSLLLGVMGNQIIFPENNQLPRDLFACGQMKQAVSLYHSNFQTRIDKMGVILNNGQIPLVKSRYLYKINKEQHPYGENVICAIMTYGGYNVEDSILFNEGSINRGLFRTTYYNSYEAREESSKVAGSQVDSRFANIEDSNVVGLKPGFNYSELDKYGLIKENTYIDDKTVLIGKLLTNLQNPDLSIDSSVFPKKGQLGYVDKAFLTEGEEGFRLAKIRVRHERIPNIGDKFVSRAGQKGTIGLVIPEENMPFTDDGLKPDIIINPHALPSRMTIGQLVETQMGKGCAILGGFGDCTAFMNKGPKNVKFGEILTENGYHSSGLQYLYNGETGEQMEAQIYMGPTFYMRLKHMVKDKINYRARGPRTVLTRQTVQGRANDGGLRIGEMERDGVIGHGMAGFLQESMLIRGDEFFMAVCNQTGMIAIYNQSYNLFLSPYSDGPIKFAGNLDSGLNIENISKFGRSFSILRIPYAFKLLMQELQTMNIQLRLITDQNIDQLENMANSKNIDHLFPFSDKNIDSISKYSRQESVKLPKEEFKPKPSKKLSNVEKSNPEPVVPPPQPKPEKTKPTDMGWFLKDGRGEDDVWSSLIIGNDGRDSDVWYVEDHDADPDTFPRGWVIEEAVYNDGLPIPPPVLSNFLRKDSQPGNWKRAIQAARNEYSPPFYPTSDSDSPAFHPSSVPDNSPSYHPEGDGESPDFHPSSVQSSPPTPSVARQSPPDSKPIIPGDFGEGIKISDNTQEDEPKSISESNLLLDIDQPENIDKKNENKKKIELS